jgi:hypothetical protein
VSDDTGITFWEHMGRDIIKCQFYDFDFLFCFGFDSTGF